MLKSRESSTGSNICMRGIYEDIRSISRRGFGGRWRDLLLPNSAPLEGWNRMPQLRTKAPIFNIYILPGWFSLALGRQSAGAMSPGLGSSAWLGICSMIVPPRATWTIVSLLSSAPLFSLSVAGLLLLLLFSVSKCSERSKLFSGPERVMMLIWGGVLLTAVGAI